MFAYLLGALVATAVPTVAPPKPVIVAPSRKPAAPDMTALLTMFDTIFPPQPAPDPTRLPLAHVTALALLPPDSLGQAVGDSMGGMVERLLAIRGSDFPSATNKKPAATTPVDRRTLREAMAAKDPFFDERLRLTRAAAEIEFKRFAAILEPRMRDGIARVVARRLDQRQLTDINAFFATDSGRALGRQFLGLWFDPDLMRSMVGGMPELIRLMPGSMERIQAATAHLPKPPRPAPPRPPARIAPKPKPARS